MMVEGVTPLRNMNDRSDHEKRDARQTGRAGDTVWSLLIVSLVAVVIWTGYRSKQDVSPAVVPPAVVREIDPVPESLDDSESPTRSGEDAESSPVYSYLSSGHPAPLRQFYPPAVVEEFVHFSSLYSLPNLRRIREPFMTREWIESFRYYCTRVARRDPVDCLLQGALLERLLERTEGVDDPWINRMQEQLAAEMDYLIDSIGAEAFNVSCGREGCVIFIATGPGVDSNAIGETMNSIAD